MKIKKMVAFVLAFAMLVSGLYIVTPDVSEVKAANTTQSQSNTIEPNVVVDGMLNVKMQIQTNQGSEKYADGSVNLRLVSSVNGLGYKNVGFEVSLDKDDNGVFDNSSAEFIKFTTGNVSKRINASVTGVTFNYSPKVIDTDAEYFVTGTLMGINQDHLSKAMYVRAFCTTMDGTVKYGTGRYFNITDATAGNIINIPVKMDAAPTIDADGKITEVDVKLGGTATEATLEKYIDGYAHVNVVVPSGDKTALDSATKVEMGTASAIYRNLESAYTGEGSEDTSWYDVYIAANSGETEFVIATAADLYGLSSLAQNNDFANKTIYVVADIDANDKKGTATATGFTRTDSATPYSWVPIGKRLADGTGESFAGTLEGGNHTISGLSISQTGDIQGAWGLFGITGDCVVRNLTITNSCFYFDTTQQMQLGCVAGQSTGTIDTVKVAENVYLTHISDNTAEVTGGIVGQMTGVVNETNVTGAKTITNCWFAGQIEAKSTVGGLLGKTYTTQLTDKTTMEHCLNTGSIALNGNSSSGVGGLCGYIEYSKLSIIDSLNAGELDSTLANTFSYYGSAIGYIRYALNKDTTSAVATISNTYAVGEENGWKRFASLSSVGKYSLNGVVTAGSAGGSISKDYCLSIESLKNEASYVNMNLDFTIEDDYTGYWTVTNGTPVLSSFLSNEETLAVKDVVTARTAWYVPGTYENTDTYTLYAKADMYGFASLTADDVGDAFAEKTVKLGADITMNEGTISDWEADSYVGLTPWTARDFAGIFDGDNHTIQGVYLNSTAGNVGLFATVSGTVQNLRLLNSYFNCTDKTTAPTKESKVYTAPVGSIAGTLSGTLDTVYSDAIVTHAGAYAGGLVGIIKDTGTINTITNCCYAGQVTANSGVGGILGLVVNTDAIIDHCLNTGLIIGGEASGGLCGYVWNTGVATSPKLTLADSLNVGKQSLTVSSYTYTGSAIGYVRNAYGTAYTCADVDATYALSTEGDDTIWTLFAYGSTRGQVTVDDNAAASGNVYHKLWSMENIINKQTTAGTAMNLSFYADGLDSSSDGETKTCWWIDEEGQIPMLESFADLLRTTVE